MDDGEGAPMNGLGGTDEEMEDALLAVDENAQVGKNKL